MITKELIEDAKAAGFHIYIGEKGRVDINTFDEDGVICDENILPELIKFAELQRQRERQAVPKLHAASYEHNGKQYAITLEGCHEEVHAHAMRLGLTIDGVIVHQEVMTIDVP
jgi:hypothetical protein